MDFFSGKRIVIVMSLAIIIVMIIVAFGVVFGLPTVSDISRKGGSGKNLILVSSHGNP